MSAAVEIRGATAEDAAAIAPLLGELGYPITAELAAERLRAFLATGDEVLVAVADGAVVGLMTLHVTPVLHRPGPVGRITGLVVARAVSRRGVGRALVEAGEARFRARGCLRVELTSSRRRTEAHAFYKAMGYADNALRFSKAL